MTRIGVPSTMAERAEPCRSFHAALALVVGVAALCRPGVARAGDAPASGEDAEIEPSATSSIESAPLGPGRAAGGIVLALAPGFGLGHAVIGEYGDHGWKFTLGEAAGLAAFFGGLSACDCLSVHHDGPNDERGSAWGAPLALIGLGTFGVLRVIEIANVLSLVSERNRTYNESIDTAVLAPAVYALPEGGGVTLRGQF